MAIFSYLECNFYDPCAYLTFHTKLPTLSIKQTTCVLDNVHDGSEAVSTVFNMRTVNTLPFVVGTVFLACLHFGEAEIQSTVGGRLLHFHKPQAIISMISMQAVAQRESKCVQNCTQWGTCNEELGRYVAMLCDI